MRLSPYDWRRQAEPIPQPTRVNLGPLTTVFVPPPYCSRAALAGSQAVLGQSCNPVDDKTASAADDTGCWPRATAYPSAAKLKLAGLGFYSPGLTCPQGHYSACTAISTSIGQTAAPPQVTGNFQFPLAAGETAIGCCPTGYTCGANGGFQTCHQVATQTSFDAMTCSGLSGSNLDGFQVPMTMNGETVATMDLYAPMFQINHMATDLPKTTSEASATSEATVGNTQATEASSSRTKSNVTASVTASATATATDEAVKVDNIETEEAETSTKATKTRMSASTSASNTDEVVKVKDVNEEIPTNTSSEEESTSKATKTASAAEKSGKATVTDASSSSPVPTIDWSSPDPTLGVGAPAGQAATEGIVFDTRLPPSMASTLLPSPTVSAAAADATASSAPESTSTSFSTGAKVGVACAPLAGAALILLGIFYYKRRRPNAGSYKEGDAKSISSDSSGPSTYQSTYFGGNTSTVQVDQAGVNNMNTYPPPVHNSPYNEDHGEHEMAMNGPGPAVIAPAGYGQPANKMTPADFYANPWTEKDEYETRPFETAASRFKHAHSLSNDAESIESPIDGASPFRLKRKSTLKGRNKLEKRITGQANERHVSMEGSIVTENPDRDSAEHPRSSQESTEWDEKGTLQRSTSFSRPRPRPKTAASSVYPDDRDSIMSWDAAMAPDMPDKPLPSIPEKGGLDRSKSFSRPRPKRDESADTLVEVEGEGRATTPVPKGVLAPPVTAEGVSF
ncbi:uncharacterized protein N0V89_005625 [Didymosphaeria variabile]|uniref:Uncharacterized protein n=1 Tax=Didymosphaeria variabile TaxID=1932322 RepID=A0A9W8XNJ6_9PLEO|nr:uncharacterized protein N0V89_005625 [Didymosphaeria variabile]KAJ4353895.1 hypothetical protein N0V89_005625 [Didymosphaeria variabile]